jgi:oligopeptide/dipeptide ABC transporter ATP-binding protein
VVEVAPVGQMFRSPVHPYTEGLLSAIPKLDVDVRRLPTIAGSIPDPTAVIPGCRYSPRCPLVQEACRRDAPELLPAGPEREARCPPRVAGLATAKETVA